MHDSTRLLDRITVAVRANLPPGVTPAHLDGFLRRHRPTLLAIIDQQLAKRVTSQRHAPAPPEEWTAAKRTAANLAAMKVAATVPPRQLTAANRQTLAGYSGWGGLSIAKAKPHFPKDFPAPEPRGLIHEYYTPAKVTDEVARVLRPLLRELAGPDGLVHTLEPSAGIGRFIRSLSGPGFEFIRWHVVEYSELSARMLQALRWDIEVYNGPFERWVRDHGDTWSGKLNLVVANPPYGARGASVTEDPARAYREKQAYAYFLRRALDLLAPGGLGVFLIPAGFLTGRSQRSLALREKVLTRHHLSAAYRLPSGLFPGAQLVTDLLFLRSRGGTLEVVDPGDAFILEGRYFEEFPGHILGTEVGKDAGDDDQTKTPRWGYQVEGTFTQLPYLVERPICGACVVGAAPAQAAAKSTGLTRKVTEANDTLPPELSLAVALGLRVDAYLAAVAAEDSREPEQLWSELHEALLAWRETHGNPWQKRKLRALVTRGVTGAERFLAAFEKSGKLIAGLRSRPTWTPRYRGRPDDVAAQAEMLYRSTRSLTAGELLDFHRKQGGRLRTTDAVVDALVETGWAVDGEGWDQLLPMDDYLVGHLWPRLDRAQARARKGDGTAAAQARRLLEAIEPAVFDDIEGVSPRQGWVPVDLVRDWLGETLNSRYGAVELVREEGLLQVRGVEYDRIDKSWELSPDARWCIGWINHDKTVFRPKKRREENLDEIRVKQARAWEASFRAWIAADDDRKARVEHAYNRSFRGYVTPTWSSEPLPVARWVKDGIQLHPHQVAGARRLLANRGGLLAFDVGVGKTYTGIAVLARARQEGWCRRPVILVPNSIVWKWEADIRRVLPDYRVAVIGSKRTVITRGERKGLATSTTDTPQDRARKWTRFQAGEFDVVLLTYTALARTRMNERAVRAYAEKTEAIQREVKLQQRNASKADALHS